MRQIARVFPVLALCLGLAACGGGGGGGGGGPVNPPAPEPPAPPELPAFASGDTAGIIQEAVTNGTSETAVLEDIENGDVTRYSTRVEIDGTEVDVSFLGVGGVENGILLVDDGGDFQERFLVGDPVALANLSDALYSGAMAYELQTGPGEDVLSATGSFTGSVNLETGVFSYGSIGPLLELFGDASVNPDGTFTDGNVLVVIRDESGNYIRDETADLEGLFSNGGGVDAVLGVFEGENGETGFILDGGFIATID